MREEQKQRGQARDFTDETGAALGNLRAFGDLLGGIGREQAQDAGLLGQVNRFKQGSSGVLNLELDEASRAGSGLRLLGDVLGLGGGMAVSSGLNGKSLGLGLGGGGSSAVKLPTTAPVPTPSPLRLGNLYG